MKPINARFEDFSEEDKRKTVVPIFEVFLKEGYSGIEVNAEGGCLEITQEFEISYLYQRAPGLVSIAGTP
jgi:hypothetical protein